MICDGEFAISVYRKSTFTGALLHFNRMAPLSWKRDLSRVYYIVRTFFHLLTRY